MAEVLEPAFPRDHRYQGHNGMSLRDYAAIHAEIPWNSVFEALSIQGEQNLTVQKILSYRAALKYAEADAMLAAREAQA